MVSLSTGFSGLTDAQSELVAHWQTRCINGVLPSRECLDPGAIRAHLSSISIVELSGSGRTKFRLAGSGLRQIFGREMRGRYLSDLDQTTFEMWSLGLSRVLDLRQPIGGMMEREDDSHAWLRLPLHSDRFGPMVLCHDALIPNLRLGAKPRHQQSHRVSLTGGSLAA